MLKLWGAAFIFSAPIIFSFSKYTAQMLQNRILLAFSEMLELSIVQIRCNLTALPCMVEHMEKNGPYLLREFWGGIKRGLGRKDTSFDHVWTQALSTLELPNEVESILAVYPDALRSYDAKQVIHTLQKMQSDIETYRGVAHRKFQRDFKMYTGVQISAALLLMILLF